MVSSSGLEQAEWQDVITFLPKLLGTVVILVVGNGWLRGLSTSATCAACSRHHRFRTCHHHPGGAPFHLNASKDFGHERHRGGWLLRCTGSCCSWSCSGLNQISSEIGPPERICSVPSFPTTSGGGGRTFCSSIVAGCLWAPSWCRSTFVVTTEHWRSSWLPQGLLSIENAIPLVIGANIGTTVTAVIAMAKMDAAGKEDGDHPWPSLFNVGGVMIALPLLLQVGGSASSPSSRRRRPSPSCRQEGASCFQYPRATEKPGGQPPLLPFIRPITAACRIVP